MSDYEDEDTGDMDEFDAPGDAPEGVVDGMIEMLLNPNGFDVENDAYTILDNLGDEYVADLIQITGSDLEAAMDVLFKNPEFRKAVAQRLTDYHEAFIALMEKYS